MTSFLKFVVCVFSLLALASPTFADDKKTDSKKAEEKDYSDPEFDSLDDTSTTGWKQGSGSKEDATEKKKEPCPKGQIRDSNDKCRDVK